MPPEKKKIMLFTDWFTPGYKAGGPIRSSLHFVQQMKEGYAIAVFTTDRDLNAPEPYENIIADKWGRFDEGVEVFYCSPEKLSWKFILKQVKTLQPDFIYLNSMYSRYFTVYPLLMRRLGIIEQPIILSPRGMLKASALQFRKSKKKFFLSLLRAMGIHKLVRFHATDTTEQEDIRLHFGHSVAVTTIPNFAGLVKDYPGSSLKNKKELRIVFVGRLHPIKNLDHLLQLLPSVSGSISLTVVGSEEDKSYVAYCKSLISSYPANIQVVFAGELPNNQLPELMEHHHIFALPTRGENFGHAIFEALAEGKPVLISDQTPWRHLVAVKAGWDIDLNRKEAFLAALQQVADFDQQEYDEWSKAAWQHARRFSEQQEVKKLYYNLFQ